jgi:hypothetical protein
MSELDLHRLARAAQLRNGAAGVTGFMVYDHGWIFQQLEGPADGLARIWASIRTDRRHAFIDVLSHGPADKCQFEDWDLKLSIHGAQAGLGPRGMADEPPELINRLWRGEKAVDLLGISQAFGPGTGTRSAAVSDTLVLCRAALSEVIATVVVPQLCSARTLPGTLPASLSVALASLLIKADEAAALALVESALDRYLSLGSLATNLLEPTARCLGDLWQSGDCTEIELSLGLIRLQTMARDFCSEMPRCTAPHSPVVLVAPLPGEGHLLGAALDAEMLWQAGWSPHVDFPASSSALDSLVASTWIDALDLSFSTAFRRDHRLGQAGKTIASARLASLNPEMVVVVSGRVFSEVANASNSAATGRHMGADGIFGSASQAQAAIVQALRRPLIDAGMVSGKQDAQQSNLNVMP